MITVLRNILPGVEGAARQNVPHHAWNAGKLFMRCYACGFWPRRMLSLVLWVIGDATSGRDRARTGIVTKARLYFERCGRRMPKQQS